jgi:hypothetical protein
LGVGLKIPPHKICSVEKLLKFETGRQFWKRLSSTKHCNVRRRRRRLRRIKEEEEEEEEDIFRAIAGGRGEWCCPPPPRPQSPKSSSWAAK